MKRIAILIVACFAGALLTTACSEKCATCSYSYTNSNGENLTTTLPETCGSNNDIDEYEAQAESAASEFGVSAVCITE